MATKISDVKLNDKIFCRGKLLVRRSPTSKEDSASWAKDCLALLLVTSCLISGCTSTPIPVAPSTPQYLDYLFPNVPEYLSGQAGVQHHNEAWGALQAGYLTQASTGFQEGFEWQKGILPSPSGAWVCRTGRAGTGTRS